MPTSRALADHAGSDCRVANVDLPDAHRRRLAELGIRDGAHVSVVQRTSGGGIVVGIGGSRVALDRRTAACILVRSDS